MHNVFPGLSLTGGAFLFSALFFGLFFRLLGLADVSAWGDEMASWYFAMDLGSVFYGESHTPLYYFLNRIWLSFFPGEVLSLRYFSIFLNVLLTGLMVALVGRYQSPRRAYLLLVLWWLWPLAVIYSRQARHYALYADLSLLGLIAWSVRDQVKNWHLWSLLSLYPMVHPFALIPVGSILASDLVLRRLRRSDFFFFATSALPVCVYYGLRFLNLGQDKVLSNIRWITSSADLFYGAMVLLFGGDSFPHKKFYPLSPLPVFLLLLLTSLILIWGRNLGALRRDFSPALRTSFIFVGTVMVVELLLLLGIDLRINRYYIYIVPVLLFFLLELAEVDRFFDIKIGLLTVSLIAFNVTILRPWGDYEWDDDHVRMFRRLQLQLGSRVLVICGNSYQLRYYFQREYEDCSQQAMLLHKYKQDFNLFDLNGNDRYIPIVVLEKARLERYESFNHALFFSFSYSEGKDHGPAKNSHHRRLERNRPRHSTFSSGKRP